MARFRLMSPTELPERKRPLTPDEVDYLEREEVLYGRWRRFYLVAAFPLTPLGVVAVVGSLYSLVLGDAVGVNSMQAFLVGMAVSVFCFSPLWLTFSMRERAREVREVLDTYPRIGDGESLQDA
jgi:hypothetical protein